jgi:hypothetical protein
MSSITFEVVNGIMAKATYDNGLVVDITILSHVSKKGGYYYSICNWAADIADTLITRI